MLRDMSQWFVAAGHDVEIITAQPAYKPSANIPKQPWQETIEGVKIRRVRLLNENGRGIIKMCNAALFILSAFFIVLFGKKRDLIWTATMPPVLQAFILMLASKVRGAKFLYHMQDIYPEIAIASGHISKFFPKNLFNQIDRFTQKHSAAIVVLSQDMKEAIGARRVDVKNVSIINNFSLILNDGEGAQLAKSPRKDELAKFIFAGNVGRFQNLSALVKAFSLLSKDEAILNIIGEGRAKDELKSIVETKAVDNVFFYDHMETSAVFKVMSECHVGVVSLSPGIYKYAFPSKVLTYMAANLPMLAMVETESNLSKVLSDRNIGTAIEWGLGEDEIASSIRALIKAVKLGDMNPAKEIDVYHQQSARENWLTLLSRLDPLQTDEASS